MAILWNLLNFWALGFPSSILSMGTPIFYSKFVFNPNFTYVFSYKSFTLRVGSGSTAYSHILVKNIQIKAQKPVLDLMGLNWILLP